MIFGFVMIFLLEKFKQIHTGNLILFTAHKNRIKNLNDLKRTAFRLAKLHKVTDFAIILKLTKNSKLAFLQHRMNSVVPGIKSSTTSGTAPQEEKLQPVPRSFAGIGSSTWTVSPSSTPPSTPTGATRAS